jgi:hypothetical protein
MSAEMTGLALVQEDYSESDVWSNGAWRQHGTLYLLFFR